MCVSAIAAFPSRLRSVKQNRRRSLGSGPPRATAPSEGEGTQPPTTNFEVARGRGGSGGGRVATRSEQAEMEGGQSLNGYTLHAQPVAHTHAECTSNEGGCHTRTKTPVKFWACVGCIGWDHVRAKQSMGRVEQSNAHRSLTARDTAARKECTCRGERIVLGGGEGGEGG